MPTNGEIRHELIALLRSIEPFDKCEENNIADAIAWIESGADLFRIKKPDVPRKHMVCYTVPIDLEAGKIFLIDHKKAGRRLPPGGHIDPEERPYETARRELEEELGIEAKFVLPDAKQPLFISQIQTVGETFGHYHVDWWYLLQGDSRAPVNQDLPEFKKEFNGFGWYALDEVLAEPIEKFDPNLHRVIRKIQKTLG